MFKQITPFTPPIIPGLNNSTLTHTNDAVRGFTCDFSRQQALGWQSKGCLINPWTSLLSQTPVKNRKSARGFPGGAVVKNPPANAGDTGSSPGPGRSHMPRSN